MPWALNGAAVFVTLFAQGHNQPLLWAVPLLLAAGALVGMINGLAIAATGVPPIIMTLAVNVILQGSILLLTGGAPTASAPPALRFLAVGRIADIPVVLVLWAMLAVVATTLLIQNNIWTLSLRSRQQCDRRQILRRTHTSDGCAFLHLCQVLPRRWLACSSPAIAGKLISEWVTLLFTSIAAVAIGGTSIMGGSGHYIGTIAGAFLLTILTRALPALNLSSGALQIVYGVVILVTVSLGSEAVSKLSFWRHPVCRFKALLV